MWRGAAVRPGTAAAAGEQLNEYPEGTEGLQRAGVWVSAHLRGHPGALRSLRTPRRWVPLATLHQPNGQGLEPLIALALPTLSASASLALRDSARPPLPPPPPAPPSPCAWPCKHSALPYASNSAAAVCPTSSSWTGSALWARSAGARNAAQRNMLDATL